MFAILLWAVWSINPTFCWYLPVLEMQNDHILFWFYLFHDHRKWVIVPFLDKRVTISGCRNVEHQEPRKPSFDYDTAINLVRSEQCTWSLFTYLEKEKEQELLWKSYCFLMSVRLSCLFSRLKNYHKFSATGKLFCCGKLISMFIDWCRLLESIEHAMIIIWLTFTCHPAVVLCVIILKRW